LGFKGEGKAMLQITPVSHHRRACNFVPLPNSAAGITIR
jgi:hypothetical protein